MKYRSDLNCVTRSSNKKIVRFSGGRDDNDRDLSLKTGVHRQGRGEHMSLPVRYAQVGGPKFLVSAREVRV